MPDHQYDVRKGSACLVNTVVPANAVTDGVPARVVRHDISDDDRRELMGLVPREWVRDAGERQEEAICRKKGL